MVKNECTQVDLRDLPFATCRLAEGVASLTLSRHEPQKETLPLGMAIFLDLL
jgi:hypothetical protein